MQEVTNTVLSHYLNMKSKHHETHLLRIALCYPTAGQDFFHFRPVPKNSSGNSQKNLGGDSVPFINSVLDFPAASCGGTGDAYISFGRWCDLSRTLSLVKTAYL